MCWREQHRRGGAILYLGASRVHDQVLINGCLMNAEKGRRFEALVYPSASYHNPHELYPEYIQPEGGSSKEACHRILPFCTAQRWPVSIVSSHHIYTYDCNDPALAPNTTHWTTLAPQTRWRALADLTCHLKLHAQHHPVLPHSWRHPQIPQSISSKEMISIML